MASERHPCPKCNGTGQDPTARYPWRKRCPVCSGAGYVDIEVDDYFGTNGDRIRAMDDVQLARFIHSLCPGNRFFCEICPHQQGCIDICNSEEKEIPDGWCEETFLAWLKTPRTERPAWIDDDKQESGLIEED